MSSTAFLAALLSALPDASPWRAESFSTSDPKGVLSLGANPAGLAGAQDWELAFEGSPQGPQRRSAALASVGPLALGWTSAPSADVLVAQDDVVGRGLVREDIWQAGLGLPLGAGFALGGTLLRRELSGTSMGWSSDLGAIWRPSRHFSAGWHWKNAGGRDAERWEGHGVGLGVRPFGNPTLQLGWETWRGDVPNLADLLGRDREWLHELQGEVRPLPWLGLQGRWIPGHDDAWSFGASAQVTPHARLFSRTQPGAGGGTLQGLGVHMGGNRLPDAGTIPQGRVLYHVGNLIGEAGQDGLLRSRKGFAQVRSDLQRLGQRRDVKVLVLDLGSGAMSLTHAGELRREIQQLRSRGIRVVAWSQDLTMASMHVMSACTRAAISPLGTVRSRGLAVRSIYFGGALRKHGVDVQLIRTGPWKSAMEPLVADRMSDEARGDLQSWLHDLDSMVLGGVAMGRNIEPTRLLGWVDSGSLLPTQAHRLGLVDTLVEPGDLLAWAAPDLSPVPLPFAAPHPEDWGARRQVVVVPLEGQIVDGKGAPGMVPWGRNLHADAVVDVLKGLAKDASVAAVVLRVNSPGGSVVGSERIRRAVAELDKSKPVVASFAGTAASGAYLFSLPARRLWAEPEALVGSIGVFTAKVSVGRLLDSLGLKVETVATSPDAGSSSVLAPLDSSQIERWTEQVQDAYRMFSRLVMDARRMDTAAFARVDGGRVFTGARAVGTRLVDSLGGLDDALATALSEARLDDADVRWLVPGSAPWEQLVSRLEATTEVSPPWARAEALLASGGWGVWAQLPWELDGP